MTLPRWIAELLWVGAGGYFGASLRYAVSGGVHLLAAPTFPWGTLTVNAAGCPLIGLLAGLAESRHVLTDATRLFLFVGLLGGVHDLLHLRLRDVRVGARRGLDACGYQRAAAILRLPHCRLGRLQPRQAMVGTV